MPRPRQSGQEKSALHPVSKALGRASATAQHPAPKPAERAHCARPDRNPIARWNRRGKNDHAAKPLLATDDKEKPNKGRLPKARPSPLRIPKRTPQAMLGFGLVVHSPMGLVGWTRYKLLYGFLRGTSRQETNPTTTAIPKTASGSFCIGKPADPIGPLDSCSSSRLYPRSIPVCRTSPEPSAEIDGPGWSAAVLNGRNRQTTRMMLRNRKAAVKNRKSRAILWYYFLLTEPGH